jgi:hypothetical protein
MPDTLATARHCAGAGAAEATDEAISAMHTALAIRPFAMAAA